MDTRDLIELLEKLENSIHAYLQEPTVERQRLLDAEIVTAKDRLKELVARLKKPTNWRQNRSRLDTGNRHLICAGRRTLAPVNPT